MAEGTSDAVLYCDRGDVKSNIRRIVRDSSGNLYATGNGSGLANFDGDVFKSTDDGDTWSDNIFNDGQFDTSIAIDSVDTKHLAYLDSGVGILYNQLDSNDNSITTETVHSSSDTLDWSPVVVDSTDTVYVVAVDQPKVMGTNYWHLHIYRRDGANNWTLLGELTGEVDHAFPSAAMDGNDDIHLFYGPGDGLKFDDQVYNKFDTSAGSFTGAEIVKPRSSGDNTTRQVILYDSNAGEPVVAYLSEEDILHAANRDGGNWPETDLTTSSEGEPSLTMAGSDYVVVYNKTSDGDIYYRKASTVSGLGSATENTLESSADTLGPPSTRWQFNNKNDPADDTIDVVFHNVTTDELFYDGVVVSSGATNTQALTETSVSVETRTVGPGSLLTSTVAGIVFKTATKITAGAESQVLTEVASPFETLTSGAVISKTAVPTIIETRTAARFGLVVQALAEKLAIGRRKGL